MIIINNNNFIEIDQHVKSLNQLDLFSNISKILFLNKLNYITVFVQFNKFKTKNKDNFR
jgi:hypothetical protein